MTNLLTEQDEIAEREKAEHADDVQRSIFRNRQLEVGAGKLLPPFFAESSFRDETVQPLLNGAWSSFRRACLPVALPVRERTYWRFRCAQRRSSMMSFSERTLMMPQMMTPTATTTAMPMMMIGLIVIVLYSMTARDSILGLRRKSRQAPAPCSLVVDRRRTPTAAGKCLLLRCGR